MVVHPMIRPRLESAPLVGAFAGILVGAALWETLVTRWGMPGPWDDALVIAAALLLSLRAILAADEEAYRIQRGRSYYGGFCRAALRWAVLGLLAPLLTLGRISSRVMLRTR